MCVTALRLFLYAIQESPVVGAGLQHVLRTYPLPVVPPPLLRCRTTLDCGAFASSMAMLSVRRGVMGCEVQVGGGAQQVDLAA